MRLLITLFGSDVVLFDLSVVMAQVGKPTGKVGIQFDSLDEILEGIVRI